MEYYKQWTYFVNSLLIISIGAHVWLWVCEILIFKFNVDTSQYDSSGTNCPTASDDVGSYKRSFWRNLESKNKYLHCNMRENSRIASKSFFRLFNTFNMFNPMSFNLYMSYLSIFGLLII